MILYGVEKSFQVAHKEKYQADFLQWRKSQLGYLSGLLHLRKLISASYFDMETGLIGITA